MHKIILIAAASALAIGLSACASLDSMIKSSDENPECRKDVHVKATPLLLFGFYVPIFDGTYDKTCHADKGHGPAVLVTPGPIVAASPPAK